MEKDITFTAPLPRKSAVSRSAASLRTSRWKERSLAYLFLAPSLILFGIFLFYPLLKSIYLSMYLTDPQGRVASFAGLDNFKNVLTSEIFYNSLWITFKFILLTVPPGVAVALLLAALSIQKLRFTKLFQFFFSLPMAVSVGTGSIIWMVLYHPTLSILNYALGLAGISPIAWLTDPKWALISISLMTIWLNLGFNYIVMLSGMQSVPEDLYESAKIDGSGSFRTFIRITLPLISPSLFFISVVSIISSFQSFAQIHILTKGGPMNSTDVLVYNIYQDAFINYRFGIGSAQALILFVLITALTIFQFKVGEKKVHYQ
ncbi:carbohydrate ABC transporter permease [Paenibacillus azoreducens]|uniref:Glycerol-3-phosphate ABC transporter permease n=1 Tax=Paenibacillus azoreducens TaxID=116718 RepID=A0A919YKE8_9BACL|nr:sugar ABC transporter permease [Paenibacillus azoreducens]GIO50975.1 glycerol-3-phosphate ABC transporter permease [Paenibacillus azoreducens]